VYLAFDLGATSGRAILGRLHAGRIELEEVSRFPNGPTVTDEGAFWDIEGLFAAMLEAMAKVAAAGVNLRSVGIDTWGVDFALLDEAGELLARPRAYRDPRLAGASRRVAERIGAQRLQDRTGSMHQDHASLCQYFVLAEREPELLARAAMLLFIPDLLRYWLCGEKATDITFVSTSQMYDVPGRQWAVDILEELGLRTDILPPVHTGPAVAGVLGPEVRARTGLGGLPVVAGCGHDTGAAFGTCLPGLGRELCGTEDLPPPDEMVVISSGTWSILGVFVDGHLPSGTLDPELFGYEANPDGSLRVIRNLTGAWLLEQCRRVWGERGVDCSYAALVSAARAAAGNREASAILDPQWDGFMHPADMTAAIAEYCRQSGQPVPQTPGQFVHVILASLAESYAQTVAMLREKTGRALKYLYMMGGMSRNRYLNELTAERAEVEVIVGPAEAAATGNVAVQVQALG